MLTYIKSLTRTQIEGVIRVSSGRLQAIAFDKKRCWGPRKRYYSFGHLILSFTVLVLFLRFKGTVSFRIKVT